MRKMLIVENEEAIADHIAEFLKEAFGIRPDDITIFTKKNNEPMPHKQIVLEAIKNNWLIFLDEQLETGEYTGSDLLRSEECRSKKVILISSSKPDWKLENNNRKIWSQKEDLSKPESEKRLALNKMVNIINHFMYSDGPL